jgi:hypothetical protein
VDPDVKWKDMCNWYYLPPNPLMIFPLTALFPIAVLNTVEDGLGADGEVIEVLRILTKIIHG